MSYIVNRQTTITICGLLLSLINLGSACAQTQGTDRVRWRFQMHSWFAGQFVTVGPDGTIYASDLSKLYALSPDGDLLWVAAGAGGRRPISIGADGTIYTVGNLIKALNPDGTLKWQFPNPSPGNPLLAGPNVGPDGNIYAMQNTLNGGIGTFSLDPDGNLRWTEEQFSASFGGSNSAIVFGEDRIYAGLINNAGTLPTLRSISFDGNFLWHSGPQDRDLSTGTFPKLDPSGRVIVGWGQTAIQAITSDGEADWTTFHPQGINLPLMPGIDAEGVIYTSPYSGLRLWAINPDGSTRWTVPFASGLLDSLNVPPDGSIILTGGSNGFGQPGWSRAYDTADGALLWQVDLAAEAGINQYVCSRQPAFTPDSQTAYFTTCFLSNVGFSFVYAIRIGDAVDPIPGDLDGDGVVGTTDLLILLGNWGPCPPKGDCPADLDGDTVVSTSDLLILFANWG